MRCGWTTNTLLKNIDSRTIHANVAGRSGAVATQLPTANQLNIGAAQVARTAAQQQHKRKAERQLDKHLQGIERSREAAAGNWAAGQAIQQRMAAEMQQQTRLLQSMASTQEQRLSVQQQQYRVGLHIATELNRFNASFSTNLADVVRAAVTAALSTTGSAAAPVLASRVVVPDDIPAAAADDDDDEEAAAAGAQQH
jgi:hypothetical protein